MPFSAIAPPSVTGTIVPPGIVLPLVSTFHIATVSTAAPLAAASGLSCRLNVHMPAGNVKPALESTVQPVQDDGIDGIAALKAGATVFANEEPRLVPGRNAAQPVVAAATRVSACGSTAPTGAVFASVYVVVGPGFVPMNVYFPVDVPEGIVAR